MATKTLTVLDDEALGIPIAELAPGMSPNGDLRAQATAPQQGRNASPSSCRITIGSRLSLFKVSKIA